MPIEVILDLGAYMRHAREVWGYRHVVLAGWSGGGSLSLLYQAEAERPTITHTPAGDAVDVAGAKLIPADAMLFQAAHVSRAVMLAEMIDPSVRNEDDPDDRGVGVCYLGNPETLNSGPVGIGRFSTLRAWLSQWSIDDTHAHGERCAARVRAPLLAIENSADDAVPQPHTRRIFDAAASEDKAFHIIRGATHYYVGQPELMQQAIDLTLEWLGARGLYE